MSVGQGSEGQETPPRQQVLPATVTLACGDLYPASLISISAPHRTGLAAHPQKQRMCYTTVISLIRLMDCWTLSRLKTEKWKPKVGAQPVQGKVYGIGCLWAFKFSTFILS